MLVFPLTYHETFKFCHVDTIIIYKPLCEGALKEYVALFYHCLTPLPPPPPSSCDILFSQIAIFDSINSVRGFATYLKRDLLMYRYKLLKFINEHASSSNVFQVLNYNSSVM
jgi:hypothetical protein